MLKRVLLALGGATVGLVLAVAAAALWAAWHAPVPLSALQRQQLEEHLDRDPGAIFMFDDATSYRYKPNFRGYRTRATHLAGRPPGQYLHITNSLGLIGSEEITSDPSRVRVLLLGDSVTYGTWVDFKDTFPARLQGLARGVCQIAIGACEGWSTRQEIAYYDKYLRRVSWNAIVLVWCLNDLVDFEWVYESSHGFRLSEEMAAAGPGLTKTSQSVSGLKLAARRVQFAADVRTAPLARQNNTTLWAWDDERWQRYLDRTLAPFVRRKDRPPLLMVAAPTRSQLESLERGADPDAVLHPQRQLLAFCRHEGVACLDLVEAFRGRRSPPMLDSLFLDDLHFSEAGHAVVAAALWPRLRSLVDEAAATLPTVSPGG